MRSKGAISRGFILPDGKIAKHGTQHDDVAMEFISENHLLDKYDKSRYRDICDFMIFEMGALKVGSNSGNPKVITFCEEKMTKEQWVYILYYQNMGYRLDAVVDKY